VAVLAAAVVLAVVLGAASSTAWAERAAEGSAPRSKFVSKLYGYELVLTGRYRPAYATIDWSGSFPSGGPLVDVFSDQQDRKFIIAAMPVKAGTTLQKWEAAQVATKESFCTKAQAFRNTTLDGESAREFVNRCPSYDVITLVARHAASGTRSRSSRQRSRLLRPTDVSMTLAGARFALPDGSGC
jgi:hypothetical protein